MFNVNVLLYSKSLGKGVKFNKFQLMMNNIDNGDICKCDQNILISCCCWVYRVVAFIEGHLLNIWTCFCILRKQLYDSVTVKILLFI